MKTSKELSIEWNLTTNRINMLCKEGKISGVIKNGKKWMIPDDAVKPEDGRVSSGKYKKAQTKKTKALPVGISDYVRMQEEYYYIDKTMMIKEFLDRRPLVSLFTRPRRFGKTINMDMLRVFFEKTEEDTSKYFRDKLIWRCGKEYTQYQGKYPVIFVSFKDVKVNSWEATCDRIKYVLQGEFERHRELVKSDKIAEYEKEYYQKIVTGNVTETDLSVSLEMLSKMLAKHYGVAPVIIIDEYDTPIQEGYSKDFYDEIIDFMRNLFSGAFKDNKNLTFGFLTGILRIAHESIFSGLNNLYVSTVLDDEYSEYFGFTHEEVRSMLRYYGKEDKEEELKNWYDGYLFGGERIYNPWSVMNYISKGCVPQAYWANSGKSEILGDILSGAEESVAEKLYRLLNGESVVTKINQNVVYKDLKADNSNIYSLLLVAGYLKTENKEICADGTYVCRVSIPNKEIAAVYRSEILSKLMQNGAMGKDTANIVAEALYENNPQKLQNAISSYLKRTISFYDAGTEGFYHGMMVGIVALMDEQYSVKSNREAGIGRYDVCLIPADKSRCGVIMEFKWGKQLSGEELSELSSKALSQIDDREYEIELREMGIKTVVKIGIAFSGKDVCVTT